MTRTLLTADDVARVRTLAEGGSINARSYSEGPFVSVPDALLGQETTRADLTAAWPAAAAVHVWSLFRLRAHLARPSALAPPQRNGAHDAQARALALDLADALAAPIDFDAFGDRFAGRLLQRLNYSAAAALAAAPASASWHAAAHDLVTDAAALLARRLAGEDVSAELEPVRAAARAVLTETRPLLRWSHLDSPSAANTTPPSVPGTPRFEGLGTAAMPYRPWREQHPERVAFASASLALTVLTPGVPASWHLQDYEGADLGLIPPLCSAADACVGALLNLDDAVAAWRADLFEALSASVTV